MPINAAAATAPYSTFTGTTLVGTWTLVTLPPWARWVRFPNPPADLSVRYPSVAEAAAYAASDSQIIIPSTTADPGRIELSTGRSRPQSSTISVRTAAAQTLSFEIGGGG